jgi:ribonuclease HI
VKTTPILTLQMYTGHLPITREIKQQAAVSLTKIRALAQNTWTPKTPDQQHLKTQMLPFNAVTSYLNQLQIPTVVEPICPTTAPTEYQSFHTKLSLLSEVKKNDTPTITLQKLAIATINERYPLKEYLRIYTDGSLSKTDGKAGAGIYSELFSHYISVGNHRTSFDGETTAIAIALQQLLLRPTAFKKAVLLVDSKSAIQAIASNKQATTQMVQEARRAIKLLTNQDKTIVFQWIPSHVGIHGNETADLLAKKGTTLLSKHTALNPETIKRLIKQKTQENFLQEATTLSNNTQWRNIKSTWENNKNKPRRQAVALFRLNTGHDCLAAHLYHIKILSHNHCTLCKQKNTTMDKDHLLQCPKLDHNSKELPKLYWDARRLME